ncbi:MAG: hypothetical protein AAGC85_21660 [Bacteroidota bacterium]
MVKDKSILDLIETLKSNFDNQILEIVDHWDADLYAIGIKKGSKLMYISTFESVVRNGDLQYYIELELINPSDQSPIKVLKRRSGLTEMKLMKEVNAFFNYKPED